MNYIYYQTDDNYAPVLGASLCSVLSCNRALDFGILVIDDGISELNKKLLLQLARSFDRKLYFFGAADIASRELMEKFDEYSGFRKNRHSYLKVLLPAMMNDDDMLLYLDCDTLGVGDVGDLLGIDLAEKPCAMALDSSVDAAYKKAIGIPATDYYFNSGVILINVGKWKSERISEKIIDLLFSGKRFGTVDQDYLNLAVANNCKVIPAKYNFQPFHRRYSPSEYFSVYQKEGNYYSESDLVDSSQDVRIIHFFRYLGLHPWDEGSLHPFEQEFEEWLDKTPWADWEFSPSQLSFPIKCERLMYRVFPKRVFLSVFKIAHDSLLKA